MVKKVSQASPLKISKNEKNKQLNSLIKVLRPKVYITDTSNFKKLVQELTGNNGITNTSPPPPPTKPEAIQEIPVIDDVEDPGVVVQSESSMEVSVDSGESCHQSQASFDDELNQAWDQIYLHETALQNLSANQNEEDWLAYQEVESWLLDVEPFPSQSYGQIEQEVCIYDYELSGILQRIV